MSAGSGAAPWGLGLCLLLWLLLAVEGGESCLGSMLRIRRLAQAESLLCGSISGKWELLCCHSPISKLQHGGHFGGGST